MPEQSFNSSISLLHYLALEERLAPRVLPAIQHRCYRQSANNPHSDRPPDTESTIIQLRNLPKAVVEMPSEQDSSVALVTFFGAFTSGPLTAVGVIILLASWLKILDALAWLSTKIAEYRARRSAENALARSMENGMVENRVVENGMIA